MPNLLPGWIRGTLKQLEACWGFIVDEEEQSVCSINTKTSMPGCVLCCEQPLARHRSREPRSLLSHQAGGFQRALSPLPSGSPPVRSSLCISRHVKAQHQPRLADPGLRERRESDSASFAGGGCPSRTIKLDGQNSLRGLGWGSPAAPLLPRLPPCPSRCRAEALLAWM